MPVTEGNCKMSWYLQKCLFITDLTRRNHTEKDRFDHMKLQILLLKIINILNEKIPQNISVKPLNI